MVIERMGAILRQHRDVSNARIDAIAEREIDNAILAREGNGRLGPFLGEQAQPLTLSASQNHRQYLAHTTTILSSAGRGPAPPLLCIAVGAMPCACPAWFIISYRQQQGRGKPSPYGIYRFVLVGHSHDESGSYRLSRPTKDGWVWAMPCACPAADALCSPCACPAADALCSPCACPVTDVKCPHML